MSRARWVVLGLVAVAVAAVVLGVTLALPPRQTAEVAVPARGATPEEVVRAYLAALDAHDCETVSRVTDRRGPESWCDDVAGVRAEVSRAVAEDPAWSGRPAGTQVVDVPVTLDLDWRLLHDHSAGEHGPQVWGYTLARASDDEPWRIVDEGTG